MGRSSCRRLGSFWGWRRVEDGRLGLGQSRSRPLTGEPVSGYPDTPNGFLFITGIKANLH
jgi:hypothetical protein